MLHVSGTNGAVLDKIAAEQQKKGTHHWQKQKGGLEEAFIYLMATASDNFFEPKEAAE